MKVEFQKGDITEADVDAIVNAANTNLLLGAGVAGAIRRKGGPAIQQECDRLGPVPLSEAAITGGGLLKARHVIHAAAMHLGGDVTAASCEAATVNSLRRAGESGLKSVAFPAIGTGVGGLGMETCARTMLGAVRRCPLASVERVVFVLYDGGALATFQRVWEELGN